VTWVKAHAGHPLNKVADEAVKSALQSNDIIHLPALRAPAGWTDHTPTLSGRSLASMTRSVVRDSTTPPYSEAKCAPFLAGWTTHLCNMTGLTLDAGLHTPPTCGN